MTLVEAIKIVRELPININLNYYVFEENKDDYVIASTSFIRKHPDIKWIFTTNEKEAHKNASLTKKDKMIGLLKKN